MKLPKYLILASLCLVIHPVLAQQPESSCKELDITISTSYSANKQGHAEVTLETRDSLNPTIYLLSGKDKKVQQKVKTLSISSVAAGDYFVLIVDENDRYCPKTLHLVIENKRE